MDMPNLPKISLSRNQIIMIAGIILLIVTVFLLFRLFGNQEAPGTPVTLTVWGTDPPEAFAAAVAGYKVLRPNVTVNYAQVSAAGYDEAVLNALATGNGPDIFSIGNHDVLERANLLAPAPTTQASVADMQGVFPQAVIQDFVYGGRIYALPLYMDTLALLYNKQVFDRAGIATPPTTWQDMLDLIPRLRVLDQGGQISRSAIAIGGSENSVAHATDILNLIMLQNGVTMSEDNGRPSFASGAPSAAALRFYMQFADAGSPAYTWNDLAGRSLESFASQRTAMVLAYQRDLLEIRRQSPFLDMGVTNAPQITADSAVNYPSYRGLAVWIGSKSVPWAWDFTIFATTNSSAQGGYLSVTGRPAALRSMIDAQQRDLNLAVFARASLTARSWKMGDYDKIKTIFSNAIQNVQTGAKTESQALGNAESQANQLVIN